MKEISKVNIKRVRNEREEMICEKCGKVKSYLITVDDKEKACCKNKMQKVIREKNYKYQIL